MYILCNSCCPTELYSCPDTSEKMTQIEIAQFFCALCQDWHIGEQPEEPLEQCKDCDLPWDEAPPLCARAYQLKHNNRRQNSIAAVTEPAVSPRPEPVREAPIQQHVPIAPAHQNGDQETTALMTLRDSVLEIAGKLEQISARLTRCENKSQNVKSDQLTPNTISTQTETDSTLHPPASTEALEMWKNYRISQKTDTQILIEALRALDLRSVLENQNSQFEKQTKMLNNMHRNMVQNTKSQDNGAPLNQIKNKRNQNIPTNKRSKKE